MYSNSQNNYIPEPFGIRDIRITNVVISLSTLTDKLRRNEIDIHQNSHVDYPWGVEKMSRLIEAILLKIPLPIFYFDVSSPFKWNSINGVQRLLTINRFIVQNALVLENMEVLTHLNGINYFGLDDSYKRILYDTQIITYQVEGQTPPLLRELIFKRIRDMNDN